MPGQTITVTWAETINHTGWYRISFQPNGQIFEIPPASNGPTGAGAVSNFPTENLTGMTDPGTGKDPLGLLQRDVTLPPDLASPRGRGLFLIHRMTAF